MNVRRPWLLIPLIALLVIGAACSSDDGGTDAGGTTPAGDGNLDGPLRLGFLWEITGESAVAIDDSQNGAVLAVDELNAQGGVGGHPIEYDRTPASCLDSQALRGQYLSAVDKDPDVLIGPGCSAQAAIARDITAAEIPVLIPTQPSPEILAGAPGGSDWEFLMASPGPQFGADGGRYAVEQLGGKRIALINSNDASNTQAAAAFKAAAEAAGGEVVVERQMAPTDTDLTEQVISAKTANVDVVAIWTYPSPTVVFVKQLEQNGVTAPIVSATSAAIAVQNGLLSGPAIAKLNVALACSPGAVGQTPALAAFTQAYQDRYGKIPSANAAYAYDAVKVAAAAATKAGSTDTEALKESLSSDTFPGACSPEYKADGANVLGHSSVVALYDGGQPKIEAEYDAPALDRVG